MLRLAQLSDRDELRRLLSQLTNCQEILSTKLAEILSRSDYQIWVYETKVDDANKLLATGTLYIEEKLTYGGRRVGHVEEVVVDKPSRGLGFGAMLVSKLVAEAKKKKCRKVLLNCSLTNENFYIKLGFRQNAVTMRLDL